MITHLCANPRLLFPPPKVKSRVIRAIVIAWVMRIFGAGQIYWLFALELITVSVAVARQAHKIWVLTDISRHHGSGVSTSLLRGEGLI